MGFFGSTKKARVVFPPLSSALGLLHMQWTRRRQPSPGAMAYSYDTLGLAPTSIISGAVAVRRQIHAVNTAPQPRANKQVPLNGTPIVSGQVMGAPLYNPNTQGFNISPNAYVGAAYERHEIAPAGYTT